MPYKKQGNENQKGVSSETVYERWFQGGKAAVTEVTKHLTDNNIFAKGAIAFLKAFSEKVERNKE